MTITTAVEANGRDYAAPKVPAIAICLDGCEPAYLDAAIADGLMPTLERMRREGTEPAGGLGNSLLHQPQQPVDCNRSSASRSRYLLATFLYDPETGEEVMMNDVRFLRAPTVFKQFFDAGAKVAIVTAKDKLRALLGAGLSFDEDRARCFSAEKSASSTAQEHGIDNASAWLGMPQPEVYSADLSEFVFAAGVKLLREWKPDVMYLTTTDYVQHKYAPEQPEAKSFYAMFDKYLAELDALGAAIVVTADHGMKPKHLADGSPSVVYLQDLMGRMAGRSACPCHPADTRPLRRASWRARLLRYGLSAGRCGCRRHRCPSACHRRHHPCADPAGGSRNLRTAGRPHWRHRHPLRRERHRRHVRGSSRPGGSERAPAQPWRPD